METDKKCIRLSAVVAMAENRAIGKNNQLLWRLPADLNHFKKITVGHPVLMGRKTYESIGKPLPGRTNIVITRDLHFSAPGCKVVRSLEEAIQEAAEEDPQEIFIIGGAQIYQQALTKLNRIYLTRVHVQLDGDTFFPELSSEWRTISQEDHQPDEHNQYAYSFLLLERI